MSSKQRPGAALDLGAQAFTVRDDAFGDEVARWQAAGCASLWPTNVYQASPVGWQPCHDGQHRYTGAPRMSAIPRYLADMLNTHQVPIHLETPITALIRQTDGWWLESEATTLHGPYTQVIISTPPPQAASLVQPWDKVLFERCQHLIQRSCWAGWAIFSAPLPRLPGVDARWQMARVDHPILRLISRNQTKPGRENQPESLSLLATLNWSEAHIEATPEAVNQQLLDALKSLYPAPLTLPERLDSGAHRWRYSQPDDANEVPPNGFACGSKGLALCGDSLRGGRVEDAWLSGHQLGKCLLTSNGVN